MSEKFINNIKRTTFWAIIFSLVTHAVLYGISFIDMVTNEGLGLDWAAVKRSSWNIVLSPFFAAINTQVVFSLLSFVCITGMVLTYRHFVQVEYFPQPRERFENLAIKCTWLTSAGLMGLIYIVAVLLTAANKISGFNLAAPSQLMLIPIIMMILLFSANYIEIHRRRRQQVTQGTQGAPEDNQ